MNTALIKRLVIKDLRIWRTLILTFLAAGSLGVGLIALLHNRIPQVVFMNLGFSLLVTPTAVLGIVLLIQTNVFEKTKATQHFIMSLPVTATDFTLAKLLVNIPVFATAWLASTATAFYFAFGLELVPAGMVPYVTMIFLGIFVAYICILSVSLLTQSLGMTVGAIMLFEILTSAYLWMILFLEPINSSIRGSVAVWNSAAVTIVAIQGAVAVAALVATLLLQTRRRDFI